MSCGTIFIETIKGFEILQEKEEEKPNATTLSDLSYFSDTDSLAADDILQVKCASLTDETNSIPSNSIQIKQGLTVMGIYKEGPIPREEELPENYTHKDMTRDQFMCRQRMMTKDANISNHMEGEKGGTKSHEEAWFLPGRGLYESAFWHMDDSDGRKEGLPLDRDILFQSVENYNLLSSNPTFASCFKGIDILESPTFGEQIIVQGCDVSQLAVGDIFEVEGGLSTLVVQISGPRLPSYYLDYSHGTPTGMKGMKRHCMTHGLAGWFARVLTYGELRDGMRFVRTKHPNPKWTIPFISKALYGEGDRKDLMMCKAHWVRSKKELIELINIPELMRYQW